MPIRAYYAASLPNFLKEDPEKILGVLASNHHHALEEQQRLAWTQQISILQSTLSRRPDGRLFLEFQIPRMGKRADAVFISGNVVFVLEFKVGSDEYHLSGLDQVEDYALDLKNFHEGSHSVPIVPILVATGAESWLASSVEFAPDMVAKPIGTNAEDLGSLINRTCAQSDFPRFDIDGWMARNYKPTPTIVEAAQILYLNHSVTDIARSDAGAKNLQRTSTSVNRLIDLSRQRNLKSICFVTGVPGSGKTLAGLNIATNRSDEHAEEHAVFLSGNDPLVNVLREALARDTVQRKAVSKKVAERSVNSFIQNVRHFRDDYVGNVDVPAEKVVVFDEAQRAWNHAQASSFMKRKRGLADFSMSEAEFLISVMNRHRDWCTVVCLVGGGQEINTGEAGLSGWISALEQSFPSWRIFVSPRILLPEYGSNSTIKSFLSSGHVTHDEDLHLAVSMRSFRAETVSEFVGHILENEPKSAKEAYENFGASYPILLTRDLSVAKKWLRDRARGTERFGLIASSGAQRLRPEGIHIKAQIEPANWFLNDSNDVRSSYFLEDVATEFAIQGLELDWAGVCWDGDFRHKNGKWIYQTFKGTKWQASKDPLRQLYQKNAYRVLLTRARQGMVIFVPRGDEADRTRPPSFYDGTFDYLQSCGIPVFD